MIHTLSFISLPLAAAAMFMFILYTVFRKRGVFAAATIITLAAFGCVTTILVTMAVQHGLRVTVIPGARYLIFAWMIMIIYFVAEFLYRIRLLGSILMPIACTMILVSMFDTNRQTRPALQFGSVTTFAHVSLIFLGLALIFLASAAAFLYLQKTSALKRHLPAAVDGRLPALPVIRQLMEVAFTGGFPALTVGIALGAVYASATLPSGWFMDVKILWGCGNWLLYAALFFLHQSRRLTTVNLARGVLLLFLCSATSFFFTKSGMLSRRATQGTGEPITSLHK